MYKYQTYAIVIALFFLTTVNVQLAQFLGALRVIYFFICDQFCSIC